MPASFSVLSSELFAICEAIKLTKNYNNNKFIILSDSQNALNAITNNNHKNPIVNQIQELYQDLTEEGNEILLCWIPSHSIIPQNDLADKKAKEAAKSNKKPNSSHIYYEYLKMVKKCFADKDAQNWCSNPDNKLLKIRKSLYEINPATSFKRKDQTVITRLRIGHTKISHIHLITKKNITYV